MFLNSNNNKNTNQWRYRHFQKAYIEEVYIQDWTEPNDVILALITD